jgi:hypothetical protein
MANMMIAAEKVLHKKSNKMLAVATKRYKKLMRQAKKAANAHKREQYLAAALGALIVTGVVAANLKAKMDSKKSANQVPVKKRRKAK